MKLLTLKEAAQCLGLSYSGVRSLVRSGRLPSYRIFSNSPRIDVDELDEFVRRSRSKPAPRMSPAASPARLK